MHVGKRRGALRWWVAGAVSLAAHLALLLVPKPAPRAPSARPIELEVVHLPSPDVSAETPRPSRAGDASAEAPRDATPNRAEPYAGHVSAETPRPAHVGDASAEAPRDVTPDRAAPHAGHVSAETPQPSEPGGASAVAPAPRRLDLLPDRYDLAAAAPAPPAAAEPPPRPPPAPPDPQQRLRAMIADDKAVDRATRNVQAYWAELRRDLDRRWRVDEELLADGPSSGLGIDLRDAWRGYTEQAAAYGATGNPYGDGPYALGSPQLNERARPLDLPEVPNLHLNGGDERSAFRKERTAYVLVVQDASGRVAGVKLHRTSGNAAFDRAALDQADRLAEMDLGIPPDGTQSLWAFNATLLITPPLPIAGCAVDAYFIPQHCFYPLSRRMKQAVRLVGVWRADETPGVR